VAPFPQVQDPAVHPEEAVAWPAHRAQRLAQVVAAVVVVLAEPRAAVAHK
jgi:hypothetical protein